MAQTIAYFITETWIKENTPITANIDPNEITPFIRSAQDIYIQELLGTSFYNHLMDGVAASTLTNDEKDLLKLIRPALAYYIVLDALPFIATKIRNIGVVEQTGDKLGSASDANIKYLRSEVKNKAEFYIKRVNDYLCVNSRLFPTYNEWVAGNMAPNPNKGYTGGLAIDRSCPGYVDFEFFKKYIYWK
jgi:hypothetical protein